MGANGERFSLRNENVRGSRVLPESPEDVRHKQLHRPKQGVSQSMAAAFCDLVSDCSYLIDPKELYVGPKIGEGAHGKVYEGKYLDMNVAVKIMQPSERDEDGKGDSRFEREVAMLARVQHKNLVKFVGACKDPVMVVVTELLAGKSLRKYLIALRPKKLELRVAVSFALDIAQAMDCLHANGIIHRDLKPDNLLLTADQKTVKLVDFGLAREETLTEMMTAETGTYRWMAPELYSTVTLRHGEKKHYNHKVDVYSFAIVLWELITNRMPFEGMSNLQAAYAAAFKKVRPSLADGFPEELVFIIQSCWAEDPDVRPNFAQVVRMLSAFLFSLPADGSSIQPVLTQKPPPVPPLRPPAIVSASKLSAMASAAAIPATVEKEPPSPTMRDTTPMRSNDDDAALPTKSKWFGCFSHCFFSAGLS